MDHLNRYQLLCRTSLRLTSTVLVFGAASTAHASLVVSNQPTQNVTCQDGGCTATAEDAILNATDLENLLGTRSYTVTTGTATNDVVIAVPLNGTDLFRKATTSVIINARIDVGKGAPVGKGLGVYINQGGSGGSLSFGSNGTIVFHSVAETFRINGKQYRLFGSIEELQSLAAKLPAGRFALEKSISAKSASPYASVVPGSFTGTIEGLGNTISKLSIGGNGSATGLFAQLGQASPALGATISDLRLKVNLATTDGSGGGALAGTAYNSTLTNVVVSGTLAATEPGANGTPLGAIVGTMSGGSMTNCASTASVTIGGAGPAIAGGLVGAAGNGAAINGAYATGAVSGVQNSVVGGLVGSAQGATISNVFATGAVSTGTGGNAGGLIGTDDGSTFATSYAAAPVAATGNAGSLIGAETGAGPTASDLYWDKTMSKLPAIGAGGSTNGMAGKTTGQLTAALPAGFAPAIWTQASGTNSGLPYLTALPVP